MKNHNHQTTDWGLDEPLRFPAHTTGWEALPSPVPTQFYEKHAGRDTYSQVIGPQTTQKILQTVCLLNDLLPFEFEAASGAISPEGWRQLYHRGTYVLECLTAPRFHAEMELRKICEQHELFEDPPAEWLGTTDQLSDLANETCYALRQTGPDTARAAWAILSAAQSIPLTKAEVLHCRWYSPEWIKALSAHLQKQ